MEDVLDVYHRPYDEKRPLVCLDEASKQLVGEVIEPIPAEPGQPERFDYEYTRNGTANLFMISEPLLGWRAVRVTERRTAVDFAEVIRWLVEDLHEEAEKVVLVMDNLNTHELASLYQPVPGSPEARRLAELRAAQQVRHPDRIPKIQLPLSGGQMVPVRYDASDRTRLVIDVAALQQRALRDYIKQEQRPKTEQNPKQQNAAAGPPWVVPVHCPNCGAPVDQATASRAADPHCEFCSQPIPVAPR